MPAEAQLRGTTPSTKIQRARPKSEQAEPARTIEPRFPAKRERKSRRHLAALYFTTMGQTIARVIAGECVASSHHHRRRSSSRHLSRQRLAGLSRGIPISLGQVSATAWRPLSHELVNCSAGIAQQVGRRASRAGRARGIGRSAKESRSQTV
jgi:hypothetical protein